MSWMRHGALALALALAGGCAEEEPAPVTRVRPVKMLDLAGGPDGRRFDYPGEVAAVTSGDLGFEVGGRITKISVREGQQVSKGDVLAELDGRDYAAQASSARASLNAAKAEYDRVQNLYVSDASSLRDLEVARRAYEVSRANYRIAAKAVEDTKLRAPFDGVVARRLADEFENVQAKQAVLRLQSEDEGLEIRVSVPERDWIAARRGGDEAPPKAFVRLAAAPDRKLPATMREYSTDADKATRTFEVAFTFDTPEDLQVQPGMTARLVLEGAEALEQVGPVSIPYRAVVPANEGGFFVWVVGEDGSSVSRVDVSLGDVRGESVDVLEGLEGDETIVTSGAPLLRADMQVKRWAFGDRADAP